MNEDADFDARLRASFRGEPETADDGFAARVLAGIAASSPAQESARAEQIAGLGAVPALVTLLALSGLMPTTLIETLLSVLLLTGACALAWIVTASDLPSGHVMQMQTPH